MLICDQKVMLMLGELDLGSFICGDNVRRSADRIMCVLLWLGTSSALKINIAASRGRLRCEATHKPWVVGVRGMGAQGGLVRS